MNVKKRVEKASAVRRQQMYQEIDSRHITQKKDAKRHDFYDVLVFLNTVTDFGFAKSTSTQAHNPDLFKQQNSRWRSFLASASLKDSILS